VRCCPAQRLTIGLKWRQDDQGFNNPETHMTADGSYRDERHQGPSVDVQCLLGERLLTEGYTG